jgi:DNA-binding XRE family transcriptional regulator
MATTGTGDPPSGVRAWLPPGAGGVLDTRAPGVIMRAYRQANRMTQQQLADLLGYDRTYISMIECGRRAITDRETLTRIARKLAIPRTLSESPNRMTATSCR